MKSDRVAESMPHHWKMRNQDSSFHRGVEAMTVSGYPLRSGPLVAQDDWQEMDLAAP